ncbi:MAG: two-component system, OmpR family, sensor histidine kinase ChvG [Alphaproteobacteria bacterium]|jgi:two-component system sensor histidine kinase ChvG|nr:two-component system, OmpR family, sensor histidine kinase ChvG [Alphaproteobacteria bacterium]MEA2988406.1 two-component system, OmpR family, sensor histidine kinase ChvG [Alphaproteobacteria bacterium]
MLERTPNIAELQAAPEQADGAASPPEPSPGLARRAWQFFVDLSFSSLTRRIIFLNLTGLVALVVGILYLSQFRAGLIDARIQSLLVQGEIIAAAIAASATVDPDSITIDPERLLDLQAGETYDPTDEALSGLDFPINPERVGPVLRRLVSPTNTRARIYDRDGALILDSRTLYDVLRFDLPPPDEERSNYFERRWLTLRRWIAKGDLPSYRELGPQNGKGYEEVAQSLLGLKSSMVRINERAEVIVSVAVPVQRFRAVRGALMLSTQGADIDEMVTAERLAIVKVFLIAAGVMIVLSFLLAGTIAGPMRRLAHSAQVVRRRTRSRVEIPDYTRRRDEIGHLSGSLREMTTALYRRIEAIESFAADVAHELKNPLTSLRSAVETLPLAKSDESRGRLLAVIEHDVKRLDRLITDISDASRLDAEMQRQEAAPVDLVRLLTMLVNVANEVPHENGVAVTLTFEGSGPFLVPGHDSRLGQVVDNLIDNARSFSPENGTVRVTCRRIKNEIEIVVDDEGPGVRPEAMHKIFERFYTDRPHQGFGQNSGLGLSISKEIVEAHDGHLTVENRMALASGGWPAKPLGARFTVRLPAM